MNSVICPYCGKTFHPQVLWPSEVKIITLLSEKRRFKYLQSETGLSAAGLVMALDRLKEKGLISKDENGLYILASNNKVEKND